MSIRIATMAQTQKELIGEVTTAANLAITGVKESYAEFRQRNPESEWFLGRMVGRISSCSYQKPTWKVVSENCERNIEFTSWRAKSALSAGNAILLQMKV